MKAKALFVTHASLAVAFTFSSVRLRADWVEWPLGNNGNRHWYLAVRTPGLISWEAARAAAANRGGYLAIITSPEENAFVFSMVANPTNWNGEFGPAIGGYQTNGASEPAGGWTWLTGEAWNYSNWGANQPDDGHGTGESALHFWGGPGGGPAPTWNDIPVALPALFGYVVERDGSPPVRPDIRVSQVGIAWDSISNATYRIEYCSALTTNQWVPLTLTNITGTGERMELRHDVPPGTPRAFYRVVDGP